MENCFGHWKSPTFVILAGAAGEGRARREDRLRRLCRFSMIPGKKNGAGAPGPARSDDEA
jgi:hypothetical protein